MYYISFEGHHQIQLHPENQIWNENCASKFDITESNFFVVFEYVFAYVFTYIFMFHESDNTLFTLFSSLN